MSPQVWPGFTAFADFSNPGTHQWWLENLQHFHAHVPFDGLWIVSPSLPVGCSYQQLSSCLLCVLAGLSLKCSFSRSTVNPKNTRLKLQHSFLCLGHE